MQQTVIVPIDFISQQVGKTVKATKKRFVWKFSINYIKHQIICDISMISKKLKLTLDGKILKTCEFFQDLNFKHSFNIQDCSCFIAQSTDNIQLRLNNRPFIHMLNQEKTKKEFQTQENQQIQDFCYEKEKLSNQQKKITLNIGGMDLKKKKNNVQSQNWDGMCVAQSSIPNYFNQQKKPQKVPQVKSQNMVVEDLKTSLGVNVMSTQHQQAVVTNNVPIIQEKSASSLMEDFNTMRQMFATKMYNVCKSVNNQNPVCQQPTHQYNTMQSLFATQVPMTQANQVNEPKINISQDNQQFNTMQILFQTQNVNNTEFKNEQNVDLNDFNTMQNIFATVNPHNMPQVIPSIDDVTSNDFNTMQNMFKTMKMKQSQTIQKFVQNKKIPNQQDYNTMQNLFATKKVDMLKKPQVNQNSEALLDIQNLNMNDFNTMQSLFKTNVNTEKIQKPQEWMKGNENNMI